MHITIIENESILSSNISKKLIKNGYNTKIYNTYSKFINSNNINSDLFIIDIGLTDGVGFDIIKHIRENIRDSSPIIITSGYSEIEKKIYGLDIGADDYLVKPFSSEELIARIRALLRRSYKKEIKEEIKYKDLILDIKNKKLTKNGIEIELTNREFQLIEFLLYNTGKLITKTNLINSVWGEYDVGKITDNNINVIISKVRKKLGKDFNFKTLINKGYILEDK